MADSRKRRYSPKRERIYECLRSADDHPTAEMIFERLRPEIPDLSLGTVYRNLKLLEETGRVRQVTTLQAEERYEARCHDHAHFVCVKCGRVWDLRTEIPSQVADSCRAERGFTIHRFNFTAEGLCEECRDEPAHHTIKTEE